MSSKDYYAVLGLVKGASDDEIKLAYRRLAQRYHPDVSTEPDRESKMREINEAWSVLGDGQKRLAYDSGKPLDTLSDLENQARQWLAGNTGKAIDEDQPNVIAWLRNAAAANENDLRKSIKEHEAKKLKLESQRKKIKVKDSNRVNLVYAVIDAKIQHCDKAVESMTKGLEVLKIVADLITDYDDIIIPPPPPPTTTINTTFIYGTTGTGGTWR